VNFFWTEEKEWKEETNVDALKATSGDDGMGAVDEGGEEKKRDKPYLYVSKAATQHSTTPGRFAYQSAVNIPTPCSSCFTFTVRAHYA
jgi:hypothetical protein